MRFLSSVGAAPHLLKPSEITFRYGEVITTTFTEQRPTDDPACKIKKPPISFEISGFYGTREHNGLLYITTIV